MRTLPAYLLLLLTSVSFSQTEGKIESINIYEKDVLILGEGRKGPYLLPDSLIIEDSEKVYIGGKLQPPSLYNMNYIDGEIRFQFIVSKGQQIQLQYKIFPYVLPRTVRHHKLQRRMFGAEPQPSRLQDSKRSEEEDYAANLTKSGSITRGVSMGNNRGLKVNSSLNLNVNGKVGDNVEVVAALTDQSTPIQPEGTTQNLQEIDRVFIQIKSPTLKATMGDFQISYTGTQFAQYNRKLQGVMGEADYEHVSAKISGAVSRGKYRSMPFNGQEGNQGPYQLKGDRGQIDIIVLAGTERVYIDGEIMIRGETNDYIIDYASAQITFTRKRLITADSRITVDFQYSDEQYRRNLYSASVKSNLWDDRIRIHTTFLHEADDKENPLDFTLTDEHMQALSRAGDDPSKAVVNGATRVDSSKGRYILDPDSIFVYAGKNKGNYNVVFSDVGSNNGAYTYKGSGIYEYVGENQARYAPVILLPTAKSHSIIDFNIDFSPFKSVNVSSEIGISNFDQNSFSSVDNDDNHGLAQNWQLSLQPDSLRFFGVNFGKLSLTGRYKDVSPTFSSIDRTTEIEYSRKWDLPDSPNQQENVREFAVRYEPFADFSMSGEYGQNNKADYFQSNRWQVQNHFSANGWPSWNYRIERISKENSKNHQKGDWLRQRGDANFKIWKIRPFVNYEGEIKKENWSDSLYTGFRFHDMAGGVEFLPFQKLRLSGTYSQRFDDEYIGLDQFVDQSTAETWNTQLELQRIKSFSASVDFTHRTRNFFSVEKNDSRTDLAEVRLHFTPFDRAINGDLNYQISNTATAKQERVYIKVSEGEGNYRYDEELNEYVNDPLGDHILRILKTDQLLPVASLKTMARLRIDPSRIFRKAQTQPSLPLWKKTLSAVSSESYLALEERSQHKNVEDIYLLNMSVFRDPETSIFGNIQFREDLHLFEHNRNFSLRFRYLTRDQLNNQFLQGGEESSEEEKNIRLTTRFSSTMSAQTEFSDEHKARYFNYSGRQNRNIFAREIKTNLSFRPSPPLEFGIEARYSGEQDRFYETPTKVQAFALVPKFNYSFKSKGRCRAEVEWSRVNATPADRIIPYEMANGRSKGQSLRWDIRFDYRFSSVIMATLSYSGRNEPERDRVIHTGRAQVTAAFR